MQTNGQSDPGRRELQNDPLGGSGRWTGSLQGPPPLHCPHCPPRFHVAQAVIPQTAPTTERSSLRDLQGGLRDLQRGCVSVIKQSLKVQVLYSGRRSWQTSRIPSPGLPAASPQTLTMRGFQGILPPALPPLDALHGCFPLGREGGTQDGLRTECVHNFLPLRPINTSQRRSCRRQEPQQRTTPDPKSPPAAWVLACSRGTLGKSILREQEGLPE